MEVLIDAEGRRVSTFMDGSAALTAAAGVI
jgi:hypothetical protein